MIGLAVAVLAIGGMFYIMVRDKRPEDFPTSAKWVFGIIGALCLFLLLVNLSGNPPKYKGYDRSPYVNYCTYGAKLTKFESGGSQWRNPDGKFCKKF